MGSETKAGTIKMIHEINVNQHARPELMGISERPEKTTCFETKQLAIVSFELMDNTMILTQKSVEVAMGSEIVIEVTSHFDLSVQTERCLTLIHFNEYLLEIIPNQLSIILTFLFLLFVEAMIFMLMYTAKA